MLAQNCIPARTESTTALLRGTAELIRELQQRLAAGESFDNPKLTKIADRVFGGSRAQGRYNPRDAYDAFEVAVSKYLESQAEALLRMYPPDALASVLRPLTRRLPRQCNRTQEQSELQQCSTTPALAYLAARLLNAQPSDIVLEPSAGTGSLAIWPRAIGARVICNETSPRRFALLAGELGFETLPLDAEIIDDLLPAQIKPTAVLMNPPFSSTGDRVARHKARYGAGHVASALRLLESRGRLVAIVGEAISFHHSTFSEWWQRIALLCNVRANLTLSANEYAKYGATPELQILVIDKTGPTPGDNWQEQLKNIHWSNAGTIEAAWEALQDLVNSPTTEPPPGNESDSDSETDTENRGDEATGL